MCFLHETTLSTNSSVNTVELSIGLDQLIDEESERPAHEQPSEQERETSPDGGG